jgi:hypothetical protein
LGRGFPEGDPHRVPEALAHRRGPAHLLCQRGLAEPARAEQSGPAGGPGSRARRARRPVPMRTAAQQPPPAPPPPAWLTPPMPALTGLTRLARAGAPDGAVESAIE